MGPQDPATAKEGIWPMHLIFTGKDPESNPAGSPTVYRTDRGSWVVQGWAITDADALASMNIPEGETAVEIPDRMLQFLASA